MESQCFQSKSTRCHYDITMSRRTRKQPPYLEQPADKNLSATTSPEEVIKVEVINKGEECSPYPRGGGIDDEEEQSNRKSLNQLMMCDGEAAKVVALVETNSGRNSRSRSHSHTLSLGDHFTVEEKKLQLVTRPQEESTGLGTKSRSGMLSRYMKVLSHLVKAKRDPSLVSRKKHILRLTT